MEMQGTHNSQNNLEKEEQLEDSHFLMSKLTTKSLVIKLVMYRYKDQWN
jgi:hypothetical protein